MATSPNTPILEGGRQRIPFFNGRVLTAEDLQTEQAAHAAAHQRLGRALGTGVLDGLFVRVGPGERPTTIVVETGTALAPSGRVVELPRRTEVSVVAETDRDTPAATEGGFADCAAQHAIITSGTGAYLLVVEPAEGPRGRVPRVGLQGDGAAGTCGAQYRIEGARLRLVCFDPTDADLVPPNLGDEIGERSDRVAEQRGAGDDPDPADLSMLRNLLAHACLGTPQALVETVDLYDTLREAARGTPPSPRGPVDGLRERGGLPEEAVPLALLYWVRDRIAFVDVWSVRRRLHRHRPQRPTPATDRRRAETDAAMWQFQDHVDSLIEHEARGGVASLRMTRHFRYVPPVGLVPVVNSQGTPGIVPETFLRGYPARSPVYAEGRRVPMLLQHAAGMPSVDLRHRTALRAYLVREAGAAREAPQTLATSPPTPAQPYLLMASGALPFIGAPRFDLSHWDLAHFADRADW